MRQPITNITLLKILESLVSLKVLVLGEAGVGKSSLMLRSVARLSTWFCQNHEDPSNNKMLFRFTDEKFSADLLPTVGIDFRVKVLPNHDFELPKYESQKCGKNSQTNYQLSRAPISQQ